MTSATIDRAGTSERLKLTVEQFDRMCEAGIFGEDDHIELLGGELYAMAPAGDWHNARVAKLNWELAARSTRVIVTVQSSVRLDIQSEPEPDVAVLRYRDDFYDPGGAKPDDILLVIEVSDSSVKRDREVKLPLYAAAGIPEVWIVTREPAAIEVYSQPREGVYTVRRIYLHGETVTTSALPDVRVAVSDITG